MVFIEKEHAYVELKHKQYQNGISDKADAFKEAAEIIESIDGVDCCIASDASTDFKTNNGWISVKDSLPDADVSVLVYAVGKDTLFSSEQDKIKAITSMSDSNILFHDIKCEKWWREPFQYFNSDYVITHWRYLPDDPEIEIT